MKKYSCPKCLSTDEVVRFGRRKKVIRLFCKCCRKHFSINPCFLDKKAILLDHLEGLSFRDLARKHEMSPMTAWRICETELKKLPDNNQFTHQNCNRFSNTFVFDAKYFNVAGSDYDWALLWGIDYFKHDIPIMLVAPSESYQSWSKFFFYFRLISHRPELIVCDDNANLKMAARKNFPQVRIQTCFNHFKENIRRNLRVRSDNTYKPFMTRIEEVFKGKLSQVDMDKRLFALFRDFRQDPVCLSVLTNIQRYEGELTAYRGINSSPVTSNIIEGLNSHLEARLVKLRSFQTHQYAKLWMNGYVLKRRTTKFTDCKGKFKPLNGKSGVEMTKIHNLILTPFF